MSDVSVLSHEYKTASEFSQTINRNLITVKIAVLKLPGAEALTSDQVDAARCALADTLGALMALLRRDENSVRGGGGAQQVPAALVARLRVERSGDLAYYLDDLAVVIARLREGPLALREADLALLDHLAAAADAETSGIFRRLMRI